MMSISMRKITYYENILEFKQNTKEQLNLNEVNNWKLCRTCLLDTNEDDVDLKKMSIIDVMQGSFLSIEEMLVQTTNIKMAKTEKLPLKICKECFTKITTSYYFAIQVSKAENILIQLANKLEDNKSEPQGAYEQEQEKKTEYNFNEMEMNDDSTLMEIEELYDSENSENVINSAKEEDETCNEKLENFPTENKEILEYDDNDFFQIETTFLAEEKNETVLKTYSSGGESHPKNDLFETIEISDVETLVPVKKSTNAKKTLIKEVSSSLGYKHKQPRVTSPLLNEIVCAICENAFERQQDLVSHVKLVHPNSKAFKCRICSNLFSHIQSLSRHMNSHKETVYLNECEYCTKTFVRVDDLKRHIRIHTGERPYVCSLCEKSFQQLTDLKFHEQKHQQEKDHTPKLYECQQCEQTYTSRNGLYLHKKKHHTQSDNNDENPYACSLCEKSFPLLFQLRFHTKQHYLLKTIKCDKCDQSYSSRNDFNLHERKHHKKIVEKN